MVQIIHSCHRHIVKSLKSSVHAKKSHLELEMIFTNHRLKITVVGLSKIYAYIHILQTEKQKQLSFFHK